MEKLRIVIGDDSFADERAEDAVDIMFCSMAETAKYKEAYPIRTKLEGNMYTGRNVVPYTAEIQVRTVKSVDELIREAEQGTYDLVVTDLDYDQFGGERGGVNVIDHLQGKYTLALCTSSRDRHLLADLGSRVQILAATGLEDDFVLNKFELLGKKISQFYMEEEKYNGGKKNE
ncbi:hypothetical protein HZA96_03895 [Candidatus Woesearchaeota archaeon]|nr:hypothetical protein [Candidatus Woesearchaeota archaeon]